MNGRICTIEIWRGKGFREKFTYTTVRDATTGELLMSCSLEDAMSAGLQRNYLYRIVPRGDQSVADNIQKELLAKQRAICALTLDSLPYLCDKCGARDTVDGGECIEGV